MKKLILLVLCSMLFSFCVEDDTTDIHTLPLRVHLPQSAISADLNANLTEADIPQLIAELNDIWLAAGIQWQLESITTDSVSETTAQAYEDALQTINEQQYGVVLRDVVTESDFLYPNGWDLYLMSNYQFGEGDYFLETHTAVLNGQSTKLVRSAAHQLGYSLSLDPSTALKNLMIVDGDSTQTLLNEFQITDARRQAKKGEGI